MDLRVVRFGILAKAEVDFRIFLMEECLMRENFFSHSLFSLLCNKDGKLARAPNHWTCFKGGIVLVSLLHYTQNLTVVRHRQWNRKNQSLLPSRDSPWSPFKLPPNVQLQSFNSLTSLASVLSKDPTWPTWVLHDLSSTVWNMTKPPTSLQGSRAPFLL